MKPRAYHVNMILMQKGHAVHKTAKRPSRQQRKMDVRKALQD